jgi:type I restriction enzyme, S subunit
MMVEMINSPELRFKGYMDSWEASPLKRSLSFISYGFTNPMPEADNGPYMITAKEISNGKINFKDARKTTATAFEELLTNKSRPKAGDILLTKDGTLGRLAVAGNELFCINQSVAVMRPITTAISQFLYQLLSTPKYQSTMLRNAGGSTIKHIYITVVDKMEIAIPSLPEQTKIADFLTAVDRRIGQLIQKKALLEDYKKGVMQQLFTQAIRFRDEQGKDFPDWEEKKLGEVYKLQGGFAFKSAEFQKSGIPIVRISNVTARGINLTEAVHYRKIRNDQNFVIENGDLLIALSGATTGKTCIYEASEVAYLNQRVGVFRKLIESDNYGFLVQLVISPIFRNDLDSVLVAGAQPNVSPKEIEGFTFSFPSPEEQTKIADFLSAIDRKIESAATQITETQTFKRGLLQQMFV